MAAGGGARDGLGRSEKVGRRGEVWPAREKGKKKRLGWAGIKGEKEREKKGFAFFFEIDSNNSIQIQIQRIQIQIEQQEIKQCSSA